MESTQIVELSANKCRGTEYKETPHTETIPATKYDPEMQNILTYYLWMFYPDSLSSMLNTQYSQFYCLDPVTSAPYSIVAL